MGDERFKVECVREDLLVFEQNICLKRQGFGVKGVSDLQIARHEGDELIFEVKHMDTRLDSQRYL